ncbi:hypothetical protein OC861_006654 [Tilletia horrida]|nr:hypothetical protein OC861_006654 [Tilletia horrida]
MSLVRQNVSLSYPAFKALKDIREHCLQAFDNYLSTAIDGALQLPPIPAPVELLRRVDANDSAGVEHAQRRNTELKFQKRKLSVEKAYIKFNKTMLTIQVRDKRREKATSSLEAADAPL